MQHALVQGALRSPFQQPADATILLRVFASCLLVGSLFHHVRQLKATAQVLAFPVAPTRRFDCTNTTQRSSSPLASLRRIYRSQQVLVSFTHDWLYEGVARGRGSYTPGSHILLRRLPGHLLRNL
jgi:hypothetical protein